MDSDVWRRRTAQLLRPSVQAAVIVQCGIGWLRPNKLALRNAVDEALLTAQVRRGSSLRIDRVVLHNLPIALSRQADFRTLAASFDEWQFRMAAACSLLSTPSPAVHRLIIPGDCPEPPLPDMVAVRANGQWSDEEQAESALRVIGAPGMTTPLTGYDVDLSGPFSDSDPSVHM
ncbi:hypothetical protein ACIQM3_12900 [Streptomyces sp. NPDC091271]|uniref:hypothetical protein n=1 Tax=Streptomyces sp. NPDC091271 TaxID=3365980 RepID=UPI0038117874